MKGDTRELPSVRRAAVVFALLAVVGTSLGVVHLVGGLGGSIFYGVGYLFVGFGFLYVALRVYSARHRLEP